MKTTILKVGSFLAAGVLVLLVATGANAVNINTHGANFHAYNAAQVTDIDYVGTGVRNLNAAARTVIGSVERSPLAAGATTGSFYVDGSNAGGATTSGTISSFNYNGTFLGSQSFSSAGATYDILLTFPAAQLSTFAYVTAQVYLPAFANGVNAVFFGVTANQ